MSGSGSALYSRGSRGCSDVGGRGSVLNGLIVSNGVTFCHLNRDFHARGELKGEDERENRRRGPPLLLGVPVGCLLINLPPTGA